MRLGELCSAPSEEEVSEETCPGSDHQNFGSQGSSLESEVQREILRVFTFLSPLL